MGLKLEDIRHGLRTFDTTFFQAPGRMNIFDEHPFKVILDYGHNPAAVEAMCQLVERLDVAGRRLVVLAAPGDRRDEDIADIGRIAAGRFDRYIVPARRHAPRAASPTRCRTSSATRCSPPAWRRSRSWSSPTSSRPWTPRSARRSRATCC